MNKISRWTVSLLSATALALGVGSCNVYEYPEVDGLATPMVLRLNFSTDMEAWDHFYTTRTTSAEDNRPEIQYTSHKQVVSNGSMRYIIKATNEQGETAEFTLNRDVTRGYNCDLPIELPAGKWSIRAWADLTSPQQNKPLYDANNFNAIERTEPHVGNTDYADAFRGTISTDVRHPYTESDLLPDTCIIEMQRPLAKYEFVSNDLQKFMSGDVISSVLRNADDQDADSRTAPDFSKLGVRIYYPTYMPSVYNMSTDKPIDSAVGQWYPTSITMLSNNEASIGFDYVLVNGHESVVTVQIGIYGADGKQISLTPPIDVPLQRNKHTVMRGAFLTTNSNSGLAINPDYDGEYNIWVPK